MHKRQLRFVIMTVIALCFVVFLQSTLYIALVDLTFIKNKLSGANQDFQKYSRVGIKLTVECSC